MANVLSYKKKKEGKVILLECMKICSPIFFLSHYNSHIKRKNKPQNNFYFRFFNLLFPLICMMILMMITKLKKINHDKINFIKNYSFSFIY